MSKKRLFQVLDEMNVNDDKNKTATLPCCFDMVGANAVKAGGHVTMGVPTEVVTKVFFGEYKPMLVLLDMKEYERLMAQPLEDFEASAKARGEIITQLNNRLTNLETALKEIQAKAKRGIFPHLPVETMGAQMSIEIDQYITDLFTPKQTTDERRL